MNNTHIVCLNVLEPEVADFVTRAARQSRDFIYALFEGLPEQSRCAIYGFADPESSEPFRSACTTLGKLCSVPELENY